jgi:hypothetical protein
VLEIDASEVSGQFLEQGLVYPAGHDRAQRDDGRWPQWTLTAPAFGPTPHERAICGRAMGRTMVSRYSMKKVVATRKGRNRIDDNVNCVWSINQSLESSRGRGNAGQRAGVATAAGRRLMRFATSRFL